MIKKILDWILGKNDSASSSHPLDGATRAAQERAEAPYKTEPPVIAPEVAVALQAAHDQVVASGQPDDSKGLDAAIAAQAAQSVVTTAPVTVKAKYKKVDLNKKTKKELLELAAQHGLVVKARQTKEELVKILAKV
jgi:hypothetical protein